MTTATRYVSVIDTIMERISLPLYLGPLVKAAKPIYLFLHATRRFPEIPKGSDES